MRIYLLRHGETILNQKKCYYGRTDAMLTKKGEEQAKKFSVFFHNISLDQVISSPLKRAMDTAALALGEKKREIILDERLSEQNFGIFEGCTYEQLQEKYPEELEKWNQNFTNYRIPQGESFCDVRKRVDDFVNNLPTEAKTILIVAHKGTLGHFLASILGMPLEGYWNFVFEQGTYSCIDLEDGYAIIRKLNQSMEDRKAEN